MIEVKKIDEAALKEIEGWYAERGWNFPRNLLPDEGYVVSQNGSNYYAAWIYRCSNANLDVIDWFIGKPLANKKELLERLIAEIAEKSAKSYVLSVFSNNLVLEKEFRKLGFIKGSQCFNYIKKR